MIALWRVPGHYKSITGDIMLDIGDNFEIVRDDVTDTLIGCIVCVRNDRAIVVVLTEAAQPPHVIPGRFNEINWTVALASPLSMATGLLESVAACPHPIASVDNNVTEIILLIQSSPIDLETVSISVPALQARIIQFADH